MRSGELQVLIGGRGGEGALAPLAICQPTGSIIDLKTVLYNPFSHWLMHCLGVNIVDFFQLPENNGDTCFVNNILIVARAVHVQ